MKKDITQVLFSLRQSKFRSRFHLKDNEILYLRDKGLVTIREHAVDFIARRLASAHPKNDGRQTPMKHHPVFVAQHATATCCRKCLEKWHHIPKGRELDAEEIKYMVNLVMAWIEHDIGLDIPKEDT